MIEAINEYEIDGFLTTQEAWETLCERGALRCSHCGDVPSFWEIQVFIALGVCVACARPKPKGKMKQRHSKKR